MAYATIAQLKAQLGISVSDTTRDTMLTSVLDAVSQSIDHYCERTFEVATGVATAKIFSVRARTQRTDDGYILVTPDIGSTTGLALGIGPFGGTYTPVSGTLELYPIEDVDLGFAATGIMIGDGSWPIGAGGRAQVFADWGWPGSAVNPVVQQATLLQAGRVFKRKDSPEGVLGSAEWGAVRVSRVDPDVESMLAPLRLHTALVG
jgi:hypothetical protein